MSTPRVKPDLDALERLQTHQRRPTVGRMKKLALLLSLLALGVPGLVACGGGDDDEATAAPATPITDDGNPYDELAADPADNKSCANPGGRGLTVVEGDFSCREARRLMHRVGYNRVPYQWRCIGPEGATGGYEVCTNLPGASSRIVIKVRFGRRAAENKSCGTAAGRGLTVVEGDISCRAARRVILLLANNSLPGSWSCTGGDADVVCTKEPAASPGIVITARFAGEAAALEVDPARKNPFVARRTVTEQGVRFSFTVPTVGWERFSSISTDKSAGGPISINKSIVGPQGAEAIIFWTGFPDGDYADPCARLLSPPVGSSAADLAAAVSMAPGTKLLTGPSNVTLGGRPAKHVALTVRENVGCDPGFFYSWRDRYVGALWPKTGGGDTITVWIVDVDGTRLFIEAETTKGFSRDLEQEVQRIVESIRFQ
jgi:hypothetical protein